MFSCRAKLNMEVEKLNGKIQRANRDRSNVRVLQEAIEAESLLPLMEWLRDHDDKVRSIQELHEVINEMKGKLQDMDSLSGCLPFVRKIEELQRLVDWNESFVDEKKLVGPKADVETQSGSVSGKEALPLSERTTRELVNLDESFVDEKKLVGQKADIETESCSVSGKEILPVSERSTIELVDSNESFVDEKNLAAPKADVKTESCSVSGKETLPVSERTTLELVDLNGSFVDEKNLAGREAEDEFEFVSVTRNETPPVSGCSTDELSNACDNPEERVMKLEDMMVQLLDRVGVLENLMLSKKN